MTFPRARVPKPDLLWRQVPGRYGPRDAPQALNERRCRHKLVLGWPQIEQIVRPALVVTYKRCRCHCVDGPGARVGVKTQGNTLSGCVPETNESEPTDDASATPERKD
jgi:hypothetical protein